MEEYPEPPVPYSGYSDLYFATQQQVRSPFVLAGYDRGELTTAPGHVTFRGMRNLVDCPGVSSLRLVRKGFPWVSLLMIAAAAGVIVYVDTPGRLTLLQRRVYETCGILLLVCVHYWRERWVEVVYTEGGLERRAYFRRTPLFRFWLGGTRTRKLFRKLRVEVLPEQGDTSA